MWLKLRALRFGWTVVWMDCGLINRIKIFQCSSIRNVPILMLYSCKAIYQFFLIQKQLNYISNLT